MSQATLLSVLLQHISDLVLLKDILLLGFITLFFPSFHGFPNFLVVIR